MIEKGIHFINVRAPYLRDTVIGEAASAFWLSKRIAKEIKKLKPDVIMLGGRFTSYFPAKLNIPKIFTTYHPDAMDFYKKFSWQNNVLNRLRFPLLKKVEEIVMHRCDIITAPNKEIQTYLFSKGFANVHLIPFGVDVKKYENRGDNNFILFAGGLRNVKGINYLIEAFSELAKEREINLVIVGSGPQEIKFKKIVRQKKLANRIHFVPLVSKVELREHYIGKCSIFVFPSLFETMGVVLLEALACGKPVVASDNMGAKQIITHKYNGLIFGKKNVPELKSCLEMYLDDEGLRQETGFNARKTVEEKYTFDKIAEEYLKLFEKFLSLKAR